MSQTIKTALINLSNLYLMTNQRWGVVADDQVTREFDTNQGSDGRDGHTSGSCRWRKCWWWWWGWWLRWRCWWWGCSGWISGVRVICEAGGGMWFAPELMAAIYPLQRIPCEWMDDWTGWMHSSQDDHDDEFSRLKSCLWLIFQGAAARPGWVLYPEDAALLWHGRRPGKLQHFHNCHNVCHNFMSSTLSSFAGSPRLHVLLHCTLRGVWFVDWAEVNKWFDTGEMDFFQCWNWLLSRSKLSYLLWRMKSDFPAITD